MVFERVTSDTGDQLRISKHSMAMERANRVCGEERKVGGRSEVRALWF